MHIQRSGQRRQRRGQHEYGNLQSISIDAKTGRAYFTVGQAGYGSADPRSHQVQNTPHQQQAYCPGQIEKPLVAIEGKAETTERRSEETRAGKERVSTCRSRWSPHHKKKKTKITQKKPANNTNKYKK